MTHFRARVVRTPRLIWLAGLVLLVAFVLRFYALDQFPPGVQHDEVFVANFARTILQGQYPIFFELNRGNEPLFMYLVAAMFRLFGENVWALRAGAALCGLGALVLTYLLAREMFDLIPSPSPAQGEGSGAAPTPNLGERWGEVSSANFIALIATALITFSFWHLYESRAGLHTISTYLLAAATFYVFWIGWTRGNRILLLLSGILAGLGAYTSRSGILVPAPLFVFVLYAFVWHRSTWRKNFPFIPILFVLAALIYFPLCRFIPTHLETALARSGDLSGDLPTLWQGNLMLLLKNAVRVFGMFGVSGDPEWRYNVAQRPIFDPLWAIFFYAGIGIALWRFKRAPYAFTLIWLFVMLLPNVLSISALSQHRAVGAIGAAFILPALALDELRVFVMKRFGNPARLAFGALCALLLAFAAYDGITAYFVTWTNNPRVRLIQRADLAIAARWLDKHQTDERALVSVEFANDLDRGSFNLVARKPNRAQFFQGADTFVLPARTSAFVVNPRSGAVHEIFKRQFLADAPAFTAKLADGTSEVDIYELTEEEFQILRTVRGLNNVAQTHEGQILIRDAYLPAGVRTGETLNAELWWQILAPRVNDADGLLWVAALRDNLHYTWNSIASLGYTPSQWQRDDVVVTLLPLRVPVDAPPQTYSFNLALASQNGTIPLVQKRDPPASPIQLGETIIARGEISDTKPDLDVRYPNQETFGDIEFFGSDAVGKAAAGTSWRVVLFWKANANPLQNYKLRLTARTVNGQELARHQEILLRDVYPTQEWRAGEYVRTVHDVEIPADAPRAHVQVRVFLFTPDDKPLGRADGASIASIEIVERVHSFGKPNPQHRRVARFGDAMELFGFDLPQTKLRAGDVFNITLYWHARGATEKPYVAFVHLLDANGKIIGKHDIEPMNGKAPTDKWQANEYITDAHTFEIAKDALKGAASVEIGFCDGATGARLPVSDADGNSLGDHLLIEELSVE